MFVKWVFTLSICLSYGRCLSPVTEYPLVSTPSGKFEGNILTSRLGKSINAFRGIRYAEAPVGELRFKPPVPIEKYEGIYNARENGPSCPQPYIGPTSEDCLLLNVYTTKLPRNNSNPKRPVMVYIHPGGFFSGGSVSYWMGPEYFMDQEIVFVTFNYRLASLGFLSTGDEHAIGNNGLKDQVVLLKWLKKKIEYFGGDPNSITLIGYSAGAWSTILHMLSPMSQGLFHKSLIMSGGLPIGNWPLPRNQLELAKKQARLFGCPDDSSEIIVKCLRTVPAEKFNNAFLQFREFGENLLLAWSPVIEANNSESSFIAEEPIHLVLEGRFQKIPVVIGQTKDEFGGYAVGVVNNKTLRDEMNNNFEKVAPITFLYERATEQSRKVSRAIKKFYLNDKPIDKSQLDNLAKIYSDSIIGFGVHRATKLLAEYNTEPVYSYCFTFQGRYSHNYLPGTNNTKPFGVAHHDDLLYLLYIRRGFPFFPKDRSSPESRMVDKLTTLYANFAKTGMPIQKAEEQFDNVEWQPFNLKKENYLDIGEKMVVKNRLYEDRFKLWEDLYPLTHQVKDSTTPEGIRQRDILKLLNLLAKMNVQLEENSAMLKKISLQNRSHSSDGFTPPIDCPTCPIRNFDDFMELDTRLSTNILKDYLIKRLSAVGGSHVPSLTRRILKSLISDEVSCFSTERAEKSRLLRS